MKVLKTYARIFVEELDRSLPVFEYLVGREAELLTAFEDAQLAAIGDFLLIAGTPDAIDNYRDTIGPVIVDDIDATEAELRARGATTHRYSAPTGTGSYIRHPDGVKVEYLQWNSNIAERVLGSNWRSPDAT